jgi:hypothetical protein
MTYYLTKKNIRNISVPVFVYQKKYLFTKVQVIMASTLS